MERNGGDPSVRLTAGPPRVLRGSSSDCGSTFLGFLDIFHGKNVYSAIY